MYYTTVFQYTKERGLENSTFLTFSKPFPFLIL